MTKTKITPLYERLSRDDELQGESIHPRLGSTDDRHGERYVRGEPE